MLKFFGIVVLAAAVLGGCKEATGPVATRYLGTYQLESFNGSVLPYTSAIDPAYKTEVMNGSITLDSDFGFRMIREWRLTYADSVRIRRSDLDGRYALTGEQIAFYGSVEGVQFGGMVTDSILTVLQPGMRIEFRRSAD